MKIEHYNHVAEHFNLKQVRLFMLYFLENAPVRELQVCRCVVTDGYLISRNGCPLFSPFKTKQYAEEILEYIKTTEIMFI